MFVANAALMKVESRSRVRRASGVETEYQAVETTANPAPSRTTADANAGQLGEIANRYLKRAYQQRPGLEEYD